MVSSEGWGWEGRGGGIEKGEVVLVGGGENGPIFLS